MPETWPQFGLFRYMKLTRRISYSEAIDILYSGNTIRLLDSDHSAYELPLLLQHLFLPERFRAIRSLEIPITLTTMQNYLYYHRKELALASGDWTGSLPQSTWDVITTMKGLRKLRVQFLCKFQAFVDAEDTEEGLPSPTEEKLLRPLLKLGWIPDFGVEVSWPADQDSKRVLLDAPFKLTRRCDEDIEVHYEKTRW